MTPDPLVTLGERLEPGEGERLSAALGVGRPWPDVLKELKAERRALLRPLLDQSRTLLGGNGQLLGAVLGAMAAAGRREHQRLDLVWSGPTPDWSEGRSTRALAAELIGDADIRVLAATYPASKHSPYVKALKGAVARGLDVTVLVDPVYLAQGAEVLAQALPSARRLQIAPVDAGAVRMHAKFVVVDDSRTLITSANFSEAAADRNLELGVVIEDLALARSLSEHVEGLISRGKLIACP